MVDPIVGDLIKEAVKSVAPVLKPAIADVIGMLGGDRLRQKRLENATRMAKKADDILSKRNVENPEAPSPSIALPILQAAADEERDGLVDLFARLLASAMDPARKDRVRVSYIEIVKQLEPLDALFLKRINQEFATYSGELAYWQRYSTTLGASPDDVWVAGQNLVKLGLVNNPGANIITMLPSGRAFLFAVSD